MKKKLTSTWKKKNTGYWPVQINDNKFATGQILRKPVEVVKGRISAGRAQKCPEPCLEGATLRKCPPRPYALQRTFYILHSPCGHYGEGGPFYVLLYSFPCTDFSNHSSPSSPSFLRHIWSRMNLSYYPNVVFSIIWYFWPLMSYCWGFFQGIGLLDLQCHFGARNEDL